MPDGDSDEIERELRELTEEVGNKSRPREPSHLERLAAASQAKKRAQRRKNSKVLTVIIVIVVAALASGTVLTWPHLRHLSLFRFPNRSPSAQAAPKVQPTPGFVNGPPADPFAGSPAEAWPTGAAGITIPAARAHGPYSAAQVRAAFSAARGIVIAGNLDWPTLRGGYPSAFAKLLIPQQRTDFLNGLKRTGPDKQGFPAGTRDWVASFAPGSTTFVTTEVKVHGWMTASEARVPAGSVLRITIDYLFTYAVEPPGAPANWMRVVNHEQGWVDFAQWNDPGGALEPWFQGTAAAAGAQCGTIDGYIHPDFPQGPPSTVQPSGTPMDPYSLATAAPPSHYECRSATRRT